MLSRRFCQESTIPKLFLCCLAGALCCLAVPDLAYAGIIEDFMKDSTTDLSKNIGDLYVNIGESTFLQSQLLPRGTFSDIYNYISNIARNITTPCAVALLSLFMMFELWRVVQQQQNRSGMPGVEQAFFVMFKAVLLYVFIDNADEIMCVMFNVSQILAGSILTDFQLPGGFGNKSSLLHDAFDLYTPEAGITSLLSLGIAWLFVWIAGMIVKFICFLRVLTAALFITFAPIGLLFFANEDTKQFAMGYLRTFIAVCIQGIMLAIIVGFIPFLMGSVELIAGLAGIQAGSGMDAGTLASSLAISGIGLPTISIVLSFLVIILTFKSSQFARQIIGG